MMRRTLSWRKGKDTDRNPLDTTGESNSSSASSSSNNSVESSSSSTSKTSSQTLLNGKSISKKLGRPPTPTNAASTSTIGTTGSTSSTGSSSSGSDSNSSSCSSRPTSFSSTNMELPGAAPPTHPAPTSSGLPTAVRRPPATSSCDSTPEGTPNPSPRNASSSSSTSSTSSSSFTAPPPSSSSSLQQQQLQQLDQLAKEREGGMEGGKQRSLQLPPMALDYDGCLEMEQGEVEGEGGGEGEGEASQSPPLLHWDHHNSTMSDSGSSVSTTASGSHSHCEQQQQQLQQQQQQQQQQFSSSLLPPPSQTTAGRRRSDSTELTPDQEAARHRSMLLRQKLAEVERKVQGAAALGGSIGSTGGLISPTGSQGSIGSFNAEMNQGSMRGLAGAFAGLAGLGNSGGGGGREGGSSISGSSGSGGGALNGGSTGAAKKAMQLVKEKFAGKRQLILLKHEREVLVGKWGIEKVERAEEEALQLFSSLDGSQGAADGQIQAIEFQACLGAVGGGCVTSEFPRVLFSTIDKDKDGVISLGDFLRWLLTMEHGTEVEKLRYGFDLCDQNKDGKIDKTDLTTTIETAFSILTGLNLQSDDVCAKRFVNTVFCRLEVGQKKKKEEGGKEGEVVQEQGKDGGEEEEEDHAISWEEFRAGSKSIETFLRTLGSRDVSCYHTPCARSRNKAATNVVFGSPKWRFITNMMLGLEFAIRGTAERKIENLTPSPSPRQSSQSSQLSQLTQQQQEYLQANNHSIGSSTSSIGGGGGWNGTHGAGGNGGLGAAFLQLTRAMNEGGNGGGGLAPLDRQDSNISSIGANSTSSFTPTTSARSLPLSSSSSSFNVGGGVVGGGPAMEGLRSELRNQQQACSKEVFSVPTSDGSKCRMASYGAEKFREVRQACGIEDDDFLLSVGIRQVIGSLLLGDLFGLSEQVSEGKSGSFFYWSQDGRYMVKTISRAESYQMRKILVSYHAHMTAHPENLLMRILGLYRLKLNNDKWDLIIIENIFTTSHGIHERFDLKGSTYERTVGARARCQPGVVMKDKDFLELGRTIHVGPELAEKLKAQIAIDSQFLARNDIIDYSFLVGVHYVDRGIPEDIWVVQQQEGLEKMYADFQALQERHGFFKKDFGLVEFGHWAYQHHHFDKEDSLSLLDANTGAAGGAYGGGGGGPLSNRNSSRSVKGGFNAASPTSSSSSSSVPLTLNARQGIRAYRTLQDQLEGEPDQILFFGIIDLLVPFDSRKRGEYLVKSFYHVGKQDFSVIPPQDYRKRFVQFVSNAIR